MILHPPGARRSEDATHRLAITIRHPRPSRPCPERFRRHVATVLNRSRPLPLKALSSRLYGAVQTLWKLDAPRHPPTSPASSLWCLTSVPCLGWAVPWGRWGRSVGLGRSAACSSPTPRAPAVAFSPPGHGNGIVGSMQGGVFLYETCPFAAQTLFHFVFPAPFSGEDGPPRM
jgi:hypothetical protein